MSNIIFGAVIGVVLFQVALVIAKRPDFIDDDMMEMIKDDKNECMEQFGTTEDMIQKASDGIITNDRKLTCYMNCLLSRLGMLDENGVVGDMMLSVMPDNLQEMGQMAMDKCGTLHGADDCEKIYNGARCLYETLPELWFMV